MKLYTTKPGDRLVDTVQNITPALAAIIKAKDYAGVMRYVTSVTPDELTACFDAGLAVGFVTYANDMDHQNQLLHLAKLGTPKGHHLFLDIEGASKHVGWLVTDPMNVAEQINQERYWCNRVEDMSYVSARYSGADQRLTGREQYFMPYKLYWHACSDVRDRFGVESVPDCSYSMYQDTHFNQHIAQGLVVDVNAIVGDMHGRTPILVCA